ncbi:MAG: AAA family ATPase [Planctomycetota bacterium]
MVTSVAVAGKGGTGKSTIASLMVLDLVARGATPVLAVDADPDANLTALLGMPGGNSIADLREDMRKKMKDFPAGMSKAQYMEAGLHQLIDEGQGFDLVTMGRGEGAGCYCYLNSLIRKFSDDLVPSYRWVVMDNEAGLEHISRRTSTSVDALIAVVTDNPLSFACAAKIAAIARAIENPVLSLCVVSSQVREDRLSRVRERIAALPMKYLGDVPHDPALEEIVYAGRSLAELGPSPVKDAIHAVIDSIGGAHGSP